MSRPLVTIAGGRLRVGVTTRRLMRAIVLEERRTAWLVAPGRLAVEPEAGETMPQDRLPCPRCRRLFRPDLAASIFFLCQACATPTKPVEESPEPAEQPRCG